MEDANMNIQHIFCAVGESTERDSDRDTVSIIFKAALN